jgi:RNA polymerase sigma factor (sigma-70 family)
MATRPAALLPLLTKTRAADAGRTSTTDRDLLSRFARNKDEVAFAALVQRHAPMVLGACRRVLGNSADAEDACQATFVILARKARSGRWQSSVASWLYATARQVALNARTARARRARHEGRATAPPTSNPLAQISGEELLAILDEELANLPGRYRAPVVLCCLEGLTRDEAARQLGVPAATLKGQLERGRRRLHDALARRGVALGAGLLAVLATSRAGASPPHLVEAIRLAAAGEVPPAVAALAEGVAMNGILKKSLAVVAVVGIATLGLGLGFMSPMSAGQQGQPPALNEARPEKKEEAKAADIGSAATGEKAFEGRVLDPDGKPVAGAKLFTLYYTPKVLPIPVRGASDKDGGFRFSVPRKDFDGSVAARPWDQALVVAVADGYGLGIPEFEWSKHLPEAAWTIRLAKDDVPITGRILNLQGQPVVGATVSVQGIYWPKKGNDLTAWVDELRERKEGSTAIRAHLRGLEGMYIGRDVGRVITPAVTNADGRFTLKGIGRERLVTLRIDSPTVASTELWAMTRPGETLRVLPWPRNLGGEEMIFTGAKFEQIVTPCRPIEGVVCDRDSSEPIPGAVVQSYQFAGRNVAGETHLQAVADKDGRYRLLGMPKGRNQIRVVPPDGQPYLSVLANVPDSPGLEPVTVNLQMKRGVWITGKVTDKVTGQGVFSWMRYKLFADNAGQLEAPGLTIDYNMLSRPDGTYRFVGVPGRAVVGAQATVGHYLRGVGADRIKDFDLLYRRTPPLGDVPPHAVAEVNPEKGAESVTCDLVLDPGRTLKGTVVGPDGKPLTNVRATGLGVEIDQGVDLEKSSEFTVWALKPGEPRLLQFTHRDRKLATALVVRGDEKDPLTVKLEPAGALTGQVVTHDGKPLAELELSSLTYEGILGLTDSKEPDLTRGAFPRGFRTDREGKFRIDGLAPGLKYRVALLKGPSILLADGDAATGVTVKSGETKDLGVIKIKVNTNDGQE